MNMTAYWELERYGCSIALINEQTEICYKDLAVMSDSLVSELATGSVFALESANNFETIAAYLGALRKGIVPLLVDDALSENLKERLYLAFNIKHVFSSTSCTWNRRGEIFKASPTVHLNLGLLLSTSGSTGSPKLVRLSKENLTSNSASIAKYLCLDSRETAITSLPLHYLYGLSILNSHLAVGAKVVVTGASITDPKFWELFKANNVTSLSGVPTMWRMLKHMRFERMNLPALRTLTQAGGRLEPDEVASLAAEQKSFGRRLFIMYGQTEATARMSYVPPEMLEQKLGSIGVAIPGGALTVEDSNGYVLGQGVEGELVYYGKNVMLGYATDSADFSKGLEVTALRTGDLGKYDKDGFFWITGRISRFIKLYGNRYSLDDVERDLLHLGYEAGAVGKDDFLIVGFLGLPEAEEELRSELARRYKIYPSAIKTVALDSLPRNSAGKLLYPELMTKLNFVDG